MKAIITGGAGFIGSHLCERLLREGFQVICIDNLITGNRANISHLSDNPGFRFIEHDVTRYIELDEKIDYILHFASPASPVDYLHYPIQTLKVGSLGTHNALGVAKARKAKFMLASTSEVYGDPQVHPQPESYWGNVNPVGMRGCYDEAKRFAEAITIAYHRIHGLDTQIVRIFNTFGPRMRINDGRVVPNFIHQALENEPLTVYGDGSQTRSFCYISDLIGGIYKLLLSDLSEPVNVGGTEEVSVLDFAKLVKRLCRSRSEIVFEELPQDDPVKRKPDIRKAKTLLKWEPKVDLEEGLKKAINWFESNVPASES